MLRKAAVLLAVSATACGGAQAPADRPGSRTPAPSGSGQRVSGDPIAGTPSFDATGAERACALPEASCAERSPAPLEFKDRCRLAGYRMIQCGCDELCTGNVAKKKLGYDALNAPKPCEPEQKDCAPPDTSAAFQDACTESGHRFVVCGCEWLCSGKLSAPVKPRPAD